MTFLQLLYFRYIAEAGSITRVAETINISPTALSKSIHQLEKELGTDLFDREGRKIVLNGNGKIFLEHVREILGSLDRAEQRLQQAPIRRLRIRGDAPFAYSTLYVILMKKARPDLVTEVVPFNRGDAPYDLRIFDSTAPIRTKKRKLELICKERYVAALPANHPLANRSSVSLSQLRNEHFAYIDYIPYEAAMADMFKEAGFTPRVDMHFSMTQVDGHHQFVREGLGCAIVPEYAWRFSDNLDNVSLVPFSDVTRTRLIYAEPEGSDARPDDVEFAIRFLKDRMTL